MATVQLLDGNVSNIATGAYENMILTRHAQDGDKVTLKTHPALADLRVEDMPKVEFEELVQKLLLLRQHYYHDLQETMPPVTDLITDL